jgi:nucleoside-diphosphate-sugar epimerase
MILLTGANGFVGRALAAQLVERGLALRCVVRGNSSSPVNESLTIRIDSISSLQDWDSGLVGIDTVIHAAARVHIMKDTEVNPLLEFRKVNTSGTLNLARQASENGVKRFIYISSIKVNGEYTAKNRPFTPDSVFVPTEPYALSKYEAEQGLLDLADKTDMEVVIIRPPLVYGAAVRANFRSLILAVNRGLPLPLGAINNRRSLVALDNLVDLIITCIGHPAAANQTFLAGDGEDLSTTELLRRIGKALGKPARLIDFPVGLLTFLASLLGKKAVAQRLCSSLQVDISKTRMLLGWEPPVSVDEGLRRTVAYMKK